MSFLSRLFNTDTAVEKAADAAINGLDKMWYTKEEQAGDQLANIKEHREYALKILEMTKGSSKARREIGLIVMIVWALVALNLMVLINVHIFVDDTIEIQTMLDFSVKYIAQPTMLVLGFYFLGNMKIGGKQ